MRKICPFLLLMATAYAREECCLDRWITFQADYGYIRRQDVRDLRLVEDASILLNKNGVYVPKKKMDTDDLAERLGWESTIRGLVAIHWNPCFSLELQYTYFYPWTAENVVNGDSLQFPFKNLSTVVDYKDASRAIGKYQSRLKNAEVNLWFHSTPQRVNFFSFSWVLGVRGMNLKEDMDLLFFRAGDHSVYSIQDKDNLIGPQLGAVLEINPSRCFTWSCMIKGAGFYNRVKNKVCVRDRNNTDKIIDYNKKKKTDSWLLEAYGQFTWNVWSKFDIHFGYQGFILTGVGLAPNNRTVHIPQSSSANVKGQIIIDGLYAGAALSF